MFVVYVIIVLIVLFLGYVLLVFNGLINAKNAIQKAYANIDVLLKQRNDEIPNLVSVVKGYAKHEKELFEGLANSRVKMINSHDVKETAKASASISQSIKGIFAIAENYPKLKANENFLALQKRLSELENQIADRREYYNDYVMNYNNRIQSFPDLVFAKMFGFKQSYELFKADDSERSNIKVELNN